MRELVDLCTEDFGHDRQDLLVDMLPWSLVHVTKVAIDRTVEVSAGYGGGGGELGWLETRSGAKKQLISVRSIQRQRHNGRQRHEDSRL